MSSDFEVISRKSSISCPSILSLIFPNPLFVSLFLLLLSSTLSDSHRIIRALYESTVIEYSIDDDDTDVTQWCSQLVEQAVMEPNFLMSCVESIGEAELKRLDNERAIEFYSQYSADIGKYFESQVHLTFEELDGGSEDLDFVRSRISDPPLEPKCNRISEIPARGRGSRGAMGENMYRPAEADGGLRFRNGVNEEIHILVRLHRRYKKWSEVGGTISGSSKFAEVNTKRETALATVEALREALEFEGCKDNVRVHILFSGDEVMRLWEGFVRDALGNIGDKLEVHKVRGGNAESFEDMLSILRSLNLPDSAIVLLLEDDCILRENSLVEIMEVFASHNPCFVVPTDPGDDYILGSPESAFPSSTIVVSGSRRHWKTATSTAVTYAARMGTLDFYAGRFPIPTNDFVRSSKLVDSEDVSILVPLPTLALTTENLSDFTEPGMAFYLSHKWARDVWEKADKRSRRLQGGGEEL